MCTCNAYPLNIKVFKVKCQFLTLMKPERLEMMNLLWCVKMVLSIE